MKNTLVIAMIFWVFQSCLVSRTSRPMLTGYVYDVSNNQPIDSCMVGDVYTNSVGYYELEEKRHREFTMPGMEAPPVMIGEIVEKEGYKSSEIKMFSKYGGAEGKGAHWKLDTIFLRRKK